jgi:nitroreductase
MTTRSREGTNDLFEAMHSMRAIRRWRPDPIPEELIWKILDAATRAPNGGNRQPWGFLVVTDAEQRKEIGRLVREEASGRIKELRDELEAGNLEPSRKLLVSSALNMFENYDSAPLIIVPCQSLPGGLESADFFTSSNIYPAVENLLLAARGVGIGSVLTTIHRRFEPELRRLLNIPDDMQPACVLPMGFPDAYFGPTRRRPIEEVTHWGGWGNYKKRS